MFFIQQICKNKNYANDEALHMLFGHYCKMQLLTESIIHVIIVNRKRIIAIMFMQAYCHFPNYVYTHCYFYVLLYLVKKRTTSSASKEKFFL